MTTEQKNITVEATINAPVETVWQCWTEPKHIVNWNNASDDWHTTEATNDLKIGGKFSSIMAAKDGSFSFDFWGIYDAVETHKLIAYTLGDGRDVTISFSQKDNQTTVTEIFEPEDENTIELQKGGWQAILDNFKKYVETLE
jgi:uncharacterized protein YndB with AHSA1/START domain